MTMWIFLMLLIGYASPFQAAPPTVSPSFQEVSLGEATVSRPNQPSLQVSESRLVPEPKTALSSHYVPTHNSRHFGTTNSQKLPKGVTARFHAARLPLVQLQHEHEYRRTSSRHYSYAAAAAVSIENEGKLYDRKALHESLLRLISSTLRGGSREFWNNGSAPPLPVEREQQELFRNGAMPILLASLGLLAAFRLIEAPAIGPLLAATGQAVGGLAVSSLAPLASVSFWSNVAPLASIALKLSPLPSILRIAREKTTGGLPFLPYSAMCTMTFCLVVYGLLVRDLRIIGTHGAGFLLSSIYCSSFIRHSKGKDSGNPNGMSREVRLHMKCGFSIASALLLSVGMLGRNAAPIVGTTSVVLSCLMYTGPLAALKKAIQSKSARNIPLPYALASIVNAIAWTIYGYFVRRDWMVWAPGLIGLVSASTQCAVNLLYSSDE